VLTIRTTVEMARSYARQCKLGAQAQNRCIEIIVLAEKKIGEELLRGQVEGRLFSPRQNRSRPAPGRDADQGGKVAIAELGLTKQQNRDFKDMAAVPVEVIHQTVEVANTEPSGGKW
jgi:hypothetical protein